MGQQLPLLVSIICALASCVPPARADAPPSARPACGNALRVAQPSATRIFTAVYESMVLDLARSVGRSIEVSTSSSWRDSLQRLEAGQIDFTVLNARLATEGLRNPDMYPLATTSGWPIVAVARAKNGPASLGELGRGRVAVVPGTHGELHARAYLSDREGYGPESDR